MQQVPPDKGQGDYQQPQNLSRTQRVLTKNLKRIRQQRDAGAKENESDNIERDGLFFAIVGHMQIDHQQAQEPNRNIHEENESPMQVSDNEASRNRSQHRTNQSGDGHEAHGADKVGFRKRSNQGEPAYWHHHRSAAALQNAARNEQMYVAGYATKKRSQREKADRRRKHPPRSKAVRHPPADRYENGQTQRVARQHGLHAERCHLQRLGNSWHGGIQNRCVQRLHEKRYGDKPRQKLLTRSGWRGWNRRRIGGTNWSYGHGVEELLY